MKVFKVAQLSDEWWELRRGVPTASEFARIITAAKAELSTSAEDYAAELIGDIVCLNPKYFTEKGRPVNTFAISNGRDREPEARRWYSLDSGHHVDEIGFAMSDDFRTGGSPDGCIGLNLEAEPAGEYRGFPFWEATVDGILELKVPLPGSQAKYLMKGEANVNGSLLRDYIQQVHGQLIVTGAQWVELCSYSGGALNSLRLRITPDAYTQKVREAVAGFLEMYETHKRQFLPQGATT